MNCKFVDNIIRKETKINYFVNLKSSLGAFIEQRNCNVWEGVGGKQEVSRLELWCLKVPTTYTLQRTCKINLPLISCDNVCFLFFIDWALL